MLSQMALKKLAKIININVQIKFSVAENEMKLYPILKNNPNLLKEFKYSDQLPSNILQYVDQIREQLIDPEDAAIEASEKGDQIMIAYADIYKFYEEHLSQNGLVDYPRMIQYAYKAFVADAKKDKSYISQFKHILIDEYQDINFAQKSMVDELLKGGSSLWVVGDDDQATYGWRGSNVKFILNFETYYEGAKLVFLNTNYRSENNIVIAANNLAKKFARRHEKNIISFGNDEVNTVFKTKARRRRVFKNS